MLEMNDQHSTPRRSMRQVLPELLDSLPHHDPAAVRSRDELHLINRIMGNHHWICRTLENPLFKDHRVLELGAGDGSLARRVWNKGIVPTARWSALDLAPKPDEWPSDSAWHQCDLFTLPSLPEAEVIVANLFLHHFQDNQLTYLGKRLPKSCRFLIACEPARRMLHTLQGHLLTSVAEFSHVTKHDMLVSIRAGFIDDELPRALGLEGWQTQITTTSLGAYRFTAWR